MEDEINLVKNHEKFIYFIANKFKNYQSKEDLYQAGVVGLLKARDNYNPNFNTKFSTYAFSSILGEMNKLIREDKGIKISREISKLNIKIEKVYSLLSQKLMREPTTLEIANFLEIPEYYVSEAILSTNKIKSLSDPITDDMNLTIEDVIGESKNIDDLIMLKDALNSLSKEEKNIITARYMNDFTQEEVGKELGISQVQVSRKEKKILKKMEVNLVKN